ncbi:MAG: hypothetical protein KatS3mg057_2162 [Herpetosiphonaceae bacterium]|nr:MAG: hypothetical protein KatS3mg057_2162 [Herpetosiphonaceae bacterium]
MKALLLLLLAVVTFVMALGTQITIFFHLTYLLLVLLVLAYAWAWSNLQGLEIERHVDNTRAQVGEFIRERLIITNRWALPKLWVEVRDHSDLPYHEPGFVAYIPGYGRRRWAIRTPCTMRGKFIIGPVTIQTGDPFGIFRFSRVDLETYDVLVYPATIDLPSFRLPVAELQGGQDIRFRTFHVTPNVSTVREYVPGDSFNRIHWPSTARTNRLIVKEFELDPSADVWLVLDMEERVHQSIGLGAMQPSDIRPGRELRLPESTEEYAVTATASLARHLLSQGRNVGLLAWGQHREIIPPERESRQLLKILEALAILRAAGSHSLEELLAADSFRFSRNTSLLIVTPSMSRRWTDSLQHLLYRGVRASVVFVDPHSFGGGHEPAPLLSRLNELRVPLYHIRQGEPLDRALREPASMYRTAGISRR